MSLYGINMKYASLIMHSRYFCSIHVANFAMQY